MKRRELRRRVDQAWRAGATGTLTTIFRTVVAAPRLSLGMWPSWGKKTANDPGRSVTRSTSPSSVSKSAASSQAVGRARGAAADADLLDAAGDDLDVDVPAVALDEAFARRQRPVAADEREAPVAEVVAAVGERREVRRVEEVRHAREERVRAEVVAEAVQRVEDHGAPGRRLMRGPRPAPRPRRAPWTGGRRRAARCRRRRTPGRP